MDKWEFTARALLIIQGAFVLGASVVAIYAYWQNRLIGHISAMATSYCLLIGIVSHSLFYEAYPRLSGKGAIVFLAYILGDYGLLRMLFSDNKETSGSLPPEHWQGEFDKLGRKINGLRKDDQK